MIDDAKLDELLSLAEKATPGIRSWNREYRGDGEYWRNSADALQVNGEPILKGDCDLGGGDTWVDVSVEDQVLIAACDPETIRALVQEVKRLRAFESAVTIKPYKAPRLDTYE